MGGTIFLIGDNENNTAVYAHLSSIGYDTIRITDCAKAYDVVAQVTPDLIMISNEVNSPASNLQYIAKLKEHTQTACLPILFIMAQDDRALRLEATKVGINDFLYAPLDFEELELKIRNYSVIAEHRQRVLAENVSLKREVAIKTSEMKANILNIKEAYGEVIMKLSLAAEYKDPETGDHINRVAYYCRELADAIGMDASFRDQIFYAAPMHDIGKIGIPDRVLLKQGALDTKEWSIMKTHSQIGYEILSEPKDSTLAMAQDIALYHHEKFDGSGYPNGVSGDAIPLSAKIMALADVYDALRSDRPYKPSFTHEKSVDIILKGDARLHPSHFDPSIIEIFQKRQKEFEDIYKESIKYAK